jgi:hypothetical protein
VGIHQRGNRVSHHTHEDENDNCGGDGWPVADADIDVKGTLTTTTWVPKHTGKRLWHVVVGVFAGVTVAPTADGARLQMQCESGMVLPPPRSRAGYYFQRASGGWGTMKLLAFESGADARFFADVLAHAIAGAADGEFDVSQSAGGFTASAVGLDVSSATAGVKAQLIVPNSLNTASIFVAETQAKAALLGAVGGGVEVPPGGAIRWKGPAFVASAAGTMTLTIGQEVTQ